MTYYPKRVFFHDARATNFLEEEPTHGVFERRNTQFTTGSGTGGESWVNGQRTGYPIRSADEIAEQDGTGTHIAMPDAPDSVISALERGGKTLAGSFPPGNYVTLTTRSGFHVFRMDDVKTDLGTTYDRGRIGIRVGLNASRDASRSANRLAALNRAYAAHYAKQRGG